MKRQFSCSRSIALGIILFVFAILCFSFAAAESGAENYEYLEVTTSFRDAVKNGTIGTGFLYSDNMLLADSNHVSTDIAKASAVLAMSVYRKSDIESVLEDKMGYTVVGGLGSYQIIDNLTLDDCDHVSYCIARKTFGDYIAYCIPVKGTGGNAEWFSNFNLGTSGRHAGFHAAAGELQEELYSLLAADGYAKNKTIIWTMGHSRGAAVANIVAGELTASGAYAPANQIFGYTYACPAVRKGAPSYNNIYNYNNAGDMIPAMPLADWGYRRYGQTVTMHCSGDSNFQRRFSSEVGSSWSSASSTNEYVSMLRTLIPSEANFYDAETQLLLKLAAYGLGGKSDVTMIEVLGSVSMDIGNDLWKRIKDITNITVLQEVLESRADTYQEYLTFIEENSVSVAGMTDEQFASFLADNQTMINAIGACTGNTIKNIADFLYAVYPMGALSETTQKMIYVVYNVFSLYLDTDGEVTEMVQDGHTQSTYVLSINSMFYGYKGWYQSGTASANFPSNIESIGANCFASCTNLSTAASSGGIKAFGSQAFSNCASLNMNMDFGGALAYIGSSAFKNCSSLVSDVDLSGPLTSIGSNAFQGCAGITEVIIPDSVVTIDDHAFRDCSGIKKVTLPISCDYSSTSYSPFYGCKNVEEIIYTAGDGTVFEAGSSDSLPACCKENLLKVTFEEGITALPKYVLKGCSKVTEIQLPSTLTKISDEAFYGCSAWTGGFPIWETTESIGDYAFKDCRSLTGTVKIPDAFTAVGRYVFQGCAGITEVIIPDSVVTIDDHAFRDCSGIKKVTLPISCDYSSTSYSPFYGCTNVEEIIYTVGDGTVFEAGTGSFKSLPDICKENLLKVTFEEGITALPKYVLKGCSKVTEIQLPSTLTKISDEAFYGCSAWTGGFPIWETTESIGDYAFKDCRSLTGTVKIPDAFTAVGRYVFQGCTGITEVIIPDRVETIGFSAFEGCSGIKKVTLPISCDYSSTFYGCTNVEEIIYTVGDGTVFEAGSCDSLPACCKENLLKVTFEEGITALPEEVLEGCSKVTEIQLPSTLTKISDEAFNGCSAWTGGFPIWETTESIGDYAFKDCWSLTGTVKIPDAFTAVGRYVFQGCAGITEVIIPDSVKTIKLAAFWDCSGIKKVTLPISCDYSSTSYSLFYGCKNVEEIIYTVGDGTVFEAGSSESLPAICKENLLKVTFEEGITALPEHVLKGCSKVTEIQLPSTLTIVSYNAFSGCTSLNTLIFPGHAPVFGSNCFYGMVAEAFYNPHRQGWTEEVRQNYGGTITWIPDEDIMAQNALLIASMPTKTAYIEGQAFDRSGMVVVFTDAELVQYEVTEYAVSPETLSLGDTLVRISYEYAPGKTAKAFVPVTVSEKTVTGIEITSPPDKTQYTAFDAFDRAGMAVTAHYDNGLADEIEGYTVETLNGSDTLRAGEPWVIVGYGGKTANAAIEVSKKAPTVRPVMTGSLYTYSTQLPPIALSDGDTPGHIAWEGVDFPLAAGEMDAAWTFAPEDGANFLPAAGSVRFTVSDASITQIRAAYTQGGQRIYPSTPLGDIMDHILVEAVHDDGSVQDITSEAVLSGELTEGESTLTLSYRGFTTTVTVSVTAIALESIDAALDTGSDTLYETATYADIRRYLTVTAAYNDGSSRDVTGEAALSGTIAAGNCVLTVEYGGLSAEVTLRVEAVAATEIEAIFDQGEAVLCPGVGLDALKAYLTVNAQYNDGSAKADIPDYVLSGTLAVPEAVITVRAGNASTSFTARVSEHPWGEYAIVEYPDATEEGLRTRECPVCGSTESLAIPVTEGISVPEKKIALGVAEEYQIYPILTPGDSAAEYTFASLKESVAKVDGDGLITAVKAGSATVTVKTMTGKKASIYVTVLAAPTHMELQDVPQEMGVGESAPYTLSFTPAKKVRNAAAVTSDDENILRVEGGNLVAVSEGTATVTATTYNRLTDSAAVTVCPAISSLSFDGDVTISVGEKKPVHARAQAGEKGGIAYSAKTKSDGKIVSVAADGTLTGKKVGTATVIAQAYNGLTAELTVRVIAPPKSVKLSVKKAKLGANGDVLSGLTATVSPAGADQGLTAATSDGEIASVVRAEDGTYTVTSGGKTGKALIRFTAVNGKTAACTVTVAKEPVEPGDAVLSKGKLTLKTRGKAGKLAVKYAKGFGGTVAAWHSSDETVATVANGRVTAAGLGTTEITAVLYNGYETPPCTVTVAAGKEAAASSPRTASPEGLLPILPTSFGKGAQIADCAFAALNKKGKIVFAKDWDGRGEMTVSMGDAEIVIVFAEGCMESVRANGPCSFAISGMEDTAGESPEVAVVKKGKLRIVGEGEAEFDGFTVSVKFPE